MSLDLLLDNLTNPALLFFLLGIIAVYLKSDLAIPSNSSKFISIYLLFSIGFKGGQELSHETFDSEVIGTILFGLFVSILIPVYAFFILKRRMTVQNSGAIAAAYGSISAVTFVTAVSYLEMQDMSVHGHMVALMALMEAPAIITGLILISIFNKNEDEKINKSKAIKHSFTNGSVLLILGSLVIGYLATAEQAEGIKPFTTDIFKGFLAIFLLDMGIISGRKLNSFLAKGFFPLIFAIVIPLINGSIVAYLSMHITPEISSRFMLAILAASASYIAVPAAMKIAVPKANPGLFLPMALAITFPVNVTLGMPIYFYLAQIT
tara:strand:- start:86244 stop:87206 length:963 start_codon:yes stop_codon:yes gene_type:complete